MLMSYYVLLLEFKVVSVLNNIQGIVVKVNPDLHFPLRGRKGERIGHQRQVL